VDAAELRAEEEKESGESRTSGLGESAVEKEGILEEEEDEHEMGLMIGNMGEEIVPSIHWDAYTCPICGRKFSGKGATGNNL
jgi:hypothetical protein